MNLIRATLDSFAKLVGVKPDDAEDAIASEEHAKKVLSRRGLFGAGAALVASKAFGLPEPTNVLQIGDVAWTFDDGELNVAVGSLKNFTIGVRFAARFDELSGWAMVEP